MQSNLRYFLFRLFFVQPIEEGAAQLGVHRSRVLPQADEHILHCLDNRATRLHPYIEAKQSQPPSLRFLVVPFNIPSIESTFDPIRP